LTKYRIKYIAGILLLVFLHFSCEQPKDYFDRNNNDPKVSLKTSTGYSPELSDLHKLSSRTNYECIFKYIDDQSFESLEVDFISGNGSWKSEDSSFFYLPDTTGQHNLVLRFLDPYSKETTCKLALNVFWNLKPVAVFEYSISNNILSIDASESYDQDSEYGGKIIDYKFVLDGNEFFLSSPQFNQNIDPEKIHIIKLQVRDNDGEWSTLISDIIPAQN